MQILTLAELCDVTGGEDCHFSWGTRRRRWVAETEAAKVCSAQAPEGSDGYYQCMKARCVTGPGFTLK